MQLIDLQRGNIVKLALKGFVHDLVLSSQDVILLSETIASLTGLGYSLVREAL